MNSGTTFPQARMPTSLADLATITVTWHPDLAILERQLHSLPEESLKVIVDNASPPQCRSRIRELSERIPRTVILPLEENVGLAAAINRGATLAAESDPPVRFLLLLDQDSIPQANSIAMLYAAFSTLEHNGLKPGAVGPLLRDPDTELTHGFHTMTRWRWRRLYPKPSDPPMPVANLNGSGTFMRLDHFLAMGGLDENLFIDHVDTEFSFRVLAAGQTLWGVPAASFEHRMGERSLRFWFFGTRLWPWRTPRRHRFLFRNAVRLMQRDYVPSVWKGWAMVKLLLTFGVHALFDPQRKEQVSEMLAGVREGLHTPRDTP